MKKTVGSLTVQVVSRLGLVALIGALLFACGPATSRYPEAVTANLVWPSPPLPPKIRWLYEIYTPQDAGVKKGFAKRLGGLLFGEEADTFVRPFGIVTDDAGRLYVADPGSALVHMFDQHGRRYEAIGAGENMLQSPIDLAVGPDGLVYVSDSATGKILRIDPQKGTLSEWITTGLERPTGLAYNPINNRFYVVDTLAHQVVAFDLDGTEQLRIGRRGNGIGEFNYPTDLGIDQQGHLVILDSLNARVQILSADGLPMSTFGRAGDIPGKFSKPKGIGLDSDGNIYVASALRDWVQIFDRQGQLLLAFGQPGKTPGTFWIPSAIWVDRNDRLYVADSYNQRVQVFQYLSGEGQ